MEKLLFKPYDKEHMRMAMLRHEATFKEQVYELHRLYQIQKILMKNICSQRKIDSDQRPINAVDFNIIDKINTGDESDGCDNVALEVIIDESEIELTLGPTSQSQRRRRTRNNSDCGPSFSSSSSGSSQINRPVRGPETASPDCQMARNKSNNVGNVEEELRLKHPPWLFQVLSLNMT